MTSKYLLLFLVALIPLTSHAFPTSEQVSVEEEGGDVEETFELAENKEEENFITDSALCSICMGALNFVGDKLNDEEGIESLCGRLKKACEYFGDAIGSGCESFVGQRCQGILRTSEGLAGNGLCRKFNMC